MKNKMFVTAIVIVIALVILTSNVRAPTFATFTGLSFITGEVTDGNLDDLIISGDSNYLEISETQVGAGGNAFTGPNNSTFYNWTHNTGCSVGRIWACVYDTPWIDYESSMIYIQPNTSISGIRIASFNFINLSVVNPNLNLSANWFEIVWRSNYNQIDGAELIVSYSALDWVSHTSVQCGSVTYGINSTNQDSSWWTNRTINAINCTGYQYSEHAVTLTFRCLDGIATGTCENPPLLFIWVTSVHIGYTFGARFNTDAYFKATGLAEFNGTLYIRCQTAVSEYSMYLDGIYLGLACPDTIIHRFYFDSTIVEDNQIIVRMNDTESSQANQPLRIDYMVLTINETAEPYFVSGPNLAMLLFFFIVISAVMLVAWKIHKSREG